MRTVWIDPDRDDHDELASALDEVWVVAGVEFLVISDDDAEVRIGTNCVEVGDWGVVIPNDPVAAAWYLVGWLDRDDADSYYDDEP
ncbi:hypothetical protein FB566_2364 [Stackebrandtia endophytica]|uniref:Uncharacterized protein n=1 Tax=Stackebrandtia endophytica TaxID=1496996 RepID=A0A543AW98_9ACTN|nr:hypothetical protein [Stackebrandtia endophytica]TQL76824.1 hypothetical protein FB566_2364 [Stackebrandtia endophytica]